VNIDQNNLLSLPPTKIYSKRSFIGSIIMVISGFFLIITLWEMIIFFPYFVMLSSMRMFSLLQPFLVIPLIFIASLIGLLIGYRVRKSGIKKVD
jgi:hypothetical protein